MSTLKNTTTTGVLIVLLAAIFISLSNVLAPIIYDAGGNPLTYLTLRFFGFLIICRLWFLCQSRPTSLPTRSRLTAYGSGTAYALGAGSLLWSFAYIPVSLAILVFFTFPILTAIITSLLDRQWPPLVKIICVIVAFFGLALALQVSVGSLHPIGVGLALLGAVGVSISYVWNGRSLQAIDTTISTLHMSIGGFIVAAIVTFFSDAISLPSETSLGWMALLGAVFSFSAAFFSMFYAVRLIGPLRTAMIMNLEPVITIALSVLVLNESLSLRQIVGAALVIISVTTFQRFGYKEKSHD